MIRTFPTTDVGIEFRGIVEDPCHVGNTADIPVIQARWVELERTLKHSYQGQRKQENVELHEPKKAMACGEPQAHIGLTFHCGHRAHGPSRNIPVEPPSCVEGTGHVNDL